MIGAVLTAIVAIAFYVSSVRKKDENQKFIAMGIFIITIIQIAIALIFDVEFVSADY